MGILMSTASDVRSGYHRIKDKSPGQLVFVRDMILPIKHIADWRYIRQCNQSQIEKYVISKNSNWINYDHRVGNQVFLSYKAANNRETPFKGLCEIVQTRTNETVTLRIGAVTNRVNIRRIKPYKKSKTLNDEVILCFKKYKWTCVHIYINTYI